MQVAGSRDQRSRMIDGEHVQRRPAVVGVLGHIRERELPVLAAVAVDVEHRIDVMVLDIHPDRMHRRDPARCRRAVGDEVHVVGDEDLRGLLTEVVDHVVEDPMVGGADGVPEAARELGDRLLLARRHEGVEAADFPIALAAAGRAVGQPYAVMQMDHVHARDRAAALAVCLRVMEVRLHPGHEAVHHGLGDLAQVGEDQVGARPDEVRARGELQVLHAGGGERRSCAGERKRRNDQCTDDCSSHALLLGAPASPRRVLKHGRGRRARRGRRINGGPAAQEAAGGYQAWAWPQCGHPTVVDTCSSNT